jgi:hypothetical protein
VLQSIDAGQLDLLIGSWLFERAHRDTDGLLVIALDGKVLRGAWTADNGQVTLFSAMIHGVGVTVAQIRVPDGTNEITQVDTVLAGVAVGTPERVIVTLDAAHTQRDTAEHLRAQRGFDYVMTVKGNQPTLQENVFAKCLPLLATAPGHVVEERAHGRINRWSTWTTDATGIESPPRRPTRLHPPRCPGSGRNSRQQRVRPHHHQQPRRTHQPRRPTHPCTPTLGH